MRQNVKRFIIAYNEINRWYDRVQNFQHRHSFVNSGFLFCCMAKWMNLLISTNAHHAVILGQRSIFMRDQIWDSCYHEQKTSGVMDSFFFSKLMGQKYGQRSQSDEPVYFFTFDLHECV